MDANRQGKDGNAANGEKIRTTAKEKEKERATEVRLVLILAGSLFYGTVSFRKFASV